MISPEMLAALADWRAHRSPPFERALVRRRLVSRALNLDRPPSPASDLGRALEEDQRRYRHRIALAAAGLDSLTPPGADAEMVSAGTRTTDQNRTPGAHPYEEDDR